ncbi:hypothetical protein [Kordia jejudonensis]|uniref:hypothetical protein n=1 Tax=Kordia jejudonensis TaxID=1348245 RepID=UPI0006292932|nr:hypothetical protein [Kordia jejudonensis]
MKKRNLKNLKLKKHTISTLKTNVVKGGTLGLICITIYSYFQCDDIIQTSEDRNGEKCDIATVNDSCFSFCDDICDDF